MVNFINITFFMLNSILATYMAVVYLLNLFRKKTILDRVGMYGESERMFSFWCSILSGLLASAYFVQDPDKLYGFSLGSAINGMLIAMVVGIFTLDAIGEWFKKLPET